LEIAERAIAGEFDLIASDKRFDWLGPGAYFWESDPQRAAEWARAKMDRKTYSKGAVVGAVIDLRNALDLTTRGDLEILKAAHASFVEHQMKAGVLIPENKPARERPDDDRSLRFLDCAVIKHLHSLLADSDVESYDTVRGMFTEGEALYPGAAFKERTHVQIAVRDPTCVLGLFWPRGDAAATVRSVLAGAPPALA
jgi:hypothetical protein